jgi:hypothetical protein
MDAAIELVKTPQKEEAREWRWPRRLRTLRISFGVGILSLDFVSDDSFSSRMKSPEKMRVVAVVTPQAKPSAGTIPLPEGRPSQPG